jgi:hypothetical protein
MSIKLKYKDRVYKFKVFEIEVDEDFNYKIKLNDIGYYNSIKKENLKILAGLIDKEVEKITDKEEIEKIEEESQFI